MRLLLQCRWLRPAPSSLATPAPTTYAGSARHRFTQCQADLQQQLESAQQQDAGPAELASLQCRQASSMPWGETGAPYLPACNPL